jgi:hypothetical protein
MPRAATVSKDGREVVLHTMCPGVVAHADRGEQGSSWWVLADCWYSLHEADARCMLGASGRVWWRGGSISLGGMAEHGCQSYQIFHRAILIGDGR